MLHVETLQTTTLRGVGGYAEVMAAFDQAQVVAIASAPSWGTSDYSIEGSVLCRGHGSGWSGPRCGHSFSSMLRHLRLQHKVCGWEGDMAAISQAWRAVWPSARDVHVTAAQTTGEGGWGSVWLPDWEYLGASPASWSEYRLNACMPA